MRVSHPLHYLLSRKIDRSRHTTTSMSAALRSATKAASQLDSGGGDDGTGNVGSAADQQHFHELYTAWIKDANERVGPESLKRFRLLFDEGVKDRTIVLRHCHLGANFCITLSTLVARSGLTKLDLRGNLIGDTGSEPLAHLLREAPALTYLDVGSNGIRYAGIEAISSSIATHRKLQTVIFGSAEPRDPHANELLPSAAKVLLDACSRCRSLKELDLSHTPVGGQGSQEAFPYAAKILTSAGGLSSLKLPGTEMSHGSAIALVDAMAQVPLSSSGSLTALDLSDNPALNYQCGVALGHLIEDRSKRTLPSPLKELRLDNLPNLGERGSATLFASLAHDRGLETLTMKSGCVDDDAAASLCRSLETNATLVHLDLTANALSEAAAVSMARALVRHPALATLTLSFNKIRDDGACALAALLERNQSLTALNLASTWVGDRGAVALGVALAGNTTLISLCLSDNHISDDGGMALAALLDKNTTLRTCVLNGNSINHSTTLQTNRIITRNRAAKRAERPNQLKREVVMLHYQLYKLDEAKAELDTHRTKKHDIERQQERFEAQFHNDEAEFRKKKKDLQDRMQQQQQEMARLEGRLKQSQEEFVRFCRKNEEDVKFLEVRLAEETQERQKTEEELHRVQQEVTGWEASRTQRLDDLKKQIEFAKEERDRWAAQAKTLREQAEQGKQKLREVQEQQSAAAAAAAAKAAGAKKGTATGGAASAATTKANSDIDALLLATSSSSAVGAATSAS